MLDNKNKKIYFQIEMDFKSLYPEENDKLIKDWDEIKKKIVQHVTAKVKDGRNMEFFRKAIYFLLKNHGK